MHNMTGRDTGTVLERGRRQQLRGKVLLYNCHNLAGEWHLRNLLLRGMPEFPETAKDLP